MNKTIAVMLISATLLCANGITGKPYTIMKGAVPSRNFQKISLDRISSKNMEKFAVRPFEEIYDVDSLESVLLPGKAVCFRVDANGDSISQIDLRDTLPDACIEAISISPKWLRNDLEQSFRHLSPEIAETCANIILSAPEEQIDEVAFCVAHMSPQSLSDDRFDPELLLINSNYIYRIADSLEYVELIEHGDFDSGDWFTTTAYWVVDSTLADTTLLEIPRDIYYWYVVHPKLSDEAPKMRDETGDTRERTYGYFWREFLWTDPHPVYSYSAGGYPLLPDWIKMAKVLWIRNDTSLAADRWITPENGALDILGEWVSTIMPDPPTSTRPIQPNQIAYYHRGNCGEVQDLLCAASRTALVPDLCVGTPLQDHVWNEFWDNGYPGEFWTEDVWHTYQVDRWGGNTALAPSWGGYDADRGGSKNINNCIGWRGDGFAIDRTPAYTQICTLIVEVSDASGNPIPGAEVMITSNSYYDPDSPFYVADIRATDHNGVMAVAMGDNCPYYYRVDSEIGCDPEPGYVTTFPGLGDGNSTAGETYTAYVTLGASLDDLPITNLSEGTGEKQIYVAFTGLGEYIRAEGAHDGQGSVYSYYKNEGIVSVFVCDSANFELYKNGEPFSAYKYRSRSIGGEFRLNLPTNDVWYVVLSEDETISNDNLVWGKVTLGTDLENVANKELPDKSALNIAPNPFNSACKIEVPDNLKNGTLQIVGITGRIFAKYNVEPGDEIIWNADDAPSGIYFAIFHTNRNDEISSKLVLIR